MEPAWYTPILAGLRPIRVIKPTRSRRGGLMNVGLTYFPTVQFVAHIPTSEHQHLGSTMQRPVHGASYKAPTSFPLYNFAVRSLPKRVLVRIASDRVAITEAIRPDIPRAVWHKGPGVSLCNFFHISSCGFGDLGGCRSPRIIGNPNR